MDVVCICIGYNLSATLVSFDQFGSVLSSTQSRDWGHYFARRVAMIGRLAVALFVLFYW